MGNDKKIILFDGVCNLCNGFVLFIIKRDAEDVFRYASLQSNIGQKLLLERNIDSTTTDSVVLIEPGVAYYIKSDAALQIGSHLKGYGSISRILYLIPSGLRNIVYDLIARYRYAWFGKKDSCMIPTPELQAKFLE
ncbi:thiol-disulfide oxidoreductase DCC family protein [Maribacter chungangensis]|uniref:Thiol-disulfide oxidoreductase DCC family protein n=1 Tax=Maribacter chungangensis TaxID=1069117 RepID=A0ABW3B2M2_9FLAO